MGEEKTDRAGRVELPAQTQGVDSDSGQCKRVYAYSTNTAGHTDVVLLQGMGGQIEQIEGRGLVLCVHACVRERETYRPTDLRINRKNFSVFLYTHTMWVVDGGSGACQWSATAGATLKPAGMFVWRGWVSGETAWGTLPAHLPCAHCL